MTEISLSPELANLDLEKFMREALLEAEAAGQAELNTLLNGGERLWTDYKRAILFTTVDIPHIIFAKHDQVIHSKLSVETNPYIRRHGWSITS